MTSFERFENRIPALIEELAVPSLPDYADDLFARTAATRQRPGWTFPERWLPMSSFTGRLAAVPHVPWRVGALIALLAVAALVAALVAGSFIHERPAPYGPAGNGQILFVNSDGDIVAGDPATGTTTTLVSGAGVSNPIYSQDGTRFAFIQPTAHGLGLFVGDAGGGDPVDVSTQGFSNPSYLGWSGRGDRILLVDAGGAMLLFDPSKPGPATDLSALLKVGPVDVGPGYNFNSAHAFRPPLGDEIMFMDRSAQVLIAVHVDGTGRHVLLDDKTSTVPPYRKIVGAEWSPDGSQLLLLLDLVESPDNWQLFVLNADGTGLHRLGNNPLDGYNSPKWSPDGTKIGFQYWTRHTTDQDQTFHGIGVLDLATGSLRDLGPKQLNGFTTWEWSPDGTSILELPGDGSNRMHIVDVATNRWMTTPWTSGDPINWQRVAPAS